MIVVGPEVPLTEGIADVCARKRALAAFGPNKAAVIVDA